ncbi:MAG: hypothetical protein KIH01_08525 [Candidatus Freyarchaeota archaeon]|nr:hypothetical protein [Candidatus Jordarchaeia archaeon]
MCGFSTCARFAEEAEKNAGYLKGASAWRRSVGREEIGIAE